MKQTLSLTLFLPVILLAAGAQAQAELRNQLQQCAEVDNVLERLACYDELSTDNAATPPPSAPAASPPVVNRPQPAAPARAVTESVPAPGSTQVAESDEPATEEDDISSFGQAPEQARVETLEDGEKALVDTITEIKRLDSTRVLITLASGQVWRQTVGKRYLLREGDTVRITASDWGNDYRLSADGKRGYIQVNRAR